ncbi:MAG: hypothetical protein HUJ68_05145 [Clostridia bacterium]|nr:hypothetical protein [Clostridia bacterium]
MKTTYQLIGVYLDRKLIPKYKPVILNSSDPNSTINISYLLNFNSETELLNCISSYLHYNSIFLNIEVDYLFNTVVSKLYIKKALQIAEIMNNIKCRNFVNFVFKGNIDFINSLLSAFY